MTKKLKQQKGETLVEALVSLLIAVMCMSILAISVTTASKLNQETNRLDEKYAVDLQMAEQRIDDNAEHDAVSGTAVIKFSTALQSSDGANVLEVSIPVTIYGGEKDDNAFVSYEKEVPEP